jgi:hypothetical protein
MDEQAINFSDQKFEEYIIQNFDKDGDGGISQCEALSIEIIICKDMGITSLQGIESMPNLKYLDCSYNHIDILDLKRNTKLVQLRCRNNHSLHTIDVSSCVDLEYLNCAESSITTLNIFRNQKLITLYCGCSNLEIVNTRNNPRLEVFSCRRNPIREIDVTMNTNLRSLNINECHISNVLLFYNKNLEWLDCRNNDLQHLDLYENRKLKFLKCIGNNSLQSIDANFPIAEVISDIEPTPKNEKDSARYHVQASFLRLRHRVAGPFAKVVMDPACKREMEARIAASLENKAAADRLYKLIGKNGVERYKTINSLDNGYFIVCNVEGKWGLLNQAGEEVVPSMYEHIESRNDGYLSAIMSNSSSSYGDFRFVMDMEGVPCYNHITRDYRQIKTRFVGYQAIGVFTGGLAVGMRGGLQGVVRRDGSVFLEPEYDSVYLQNTSILVKKDDIIRTILYFEGLKTWRFLPIGYSLFYNNPIKKEYKVGKHYLVKKDDKMGMLDFSGNLVIPPIYTDLNFFDSEDIIIATNAQGKKGIIRRSDYRTILLNFEYDKIYRTYMDHRHPINGGKSWLSSIYYRKKRLNRSMYKRGRNTYCPHDRQRDCHSS